MTERFMDVVRVPSDSAVAPGIHRWAAALTRATLDDMRILAAQITIATAICLIAYVQMLRIAPLNPQNFSTFLCDRLGVTFATVDLPHAKGVDLDAAWRPRILSVYWAGLMTEDAVTPGQVDSQLFSERVALWTTLWLGAIFFLYIVTFGRSALFYIFGTSAGLGFGYTENLGSLRVYPWDMPALFFFVLFICLIYKRRELWFLPVLPFALLFKETALVLIPAYFWVAGDRRRRWALLGLAAVLGLVPKLLLDAYLGVPGRLLVDLDLLLANLRFVATHVTPWLINAGLVAGFVLIPLGGRIAWMLRAICATFLAVGMVYGFVFEYRIWFELIPVCLYGLSLGLAVPAGEARQPGPL